MTFCPKPEKLTPPVCGKCKGPKTFTLWGGGWNCLPCKPVCKHCNGSKEIAVVGNFKMECKHCKPKPIVFPIIKNPLPEVSLLEGMKNHFSLLPIEQIGPTISLDEVKKRRFDLLPPKDEDDL